MTTYLKHSHEQKLTNTPNTAGLGLIGSYAAQQYSQLGWAMHRIRCRELRDAQWIHHRVEKPGDPELIEINDALQAADAPLEHVTFYQAGFAEVLDTETRLLELCGQLVELTVLPPFTA